MKNYIKQKMDSTIFALINVGGYGIQKFLVKIIIGRKNRECGLFAL